MPEPAEVSVVTKRLTEAMDRLRVPGAAVGVLLGGEEHVAGFGVTSIEHPLPVDGDALFQIGSISKTVTGTAAMRLVERGALDLDAPVQTYVPGLRLADADAAARVTMRHLFTHTAGWVGDYFDDFGCGDDALAKIVGAMASLPQLTPLGSVWSYNNAGFYLAGLVMETVTGQPFETVVKDLVLEPLGMTRSCFFAHDAIVHRVAVGHRIRDERPVVATPWALPRSAHPAGGITASVRDLLRYARFHVGDGTGPDGSRLLSQAALQAMRSPQVPGELDDEWGITWGLRRVDGVRLVRHGGATNGFMASLVLAPDRGFAVAVLTNSESGNLLHEEITRWALERFLGIAARDPAPVEMSPDRLVEYGGHYAGAMMDLELRLQDGGLVLYAQPKGGFPVKDSPPPPAPPPMRVACTGDDRFIIVEGPMKGRRGEVLRDASGRIVWLRSSRIFARQT